MIGETIPNTIIPGNPMPGAKLRTPTVATLTGIVDLINPDPATITLEAMSHHLALLNRYCGATELPFSVAQHSLLTSDIFRRLYPGLPAIYAKLHDAHEYLIGDWVRPVQHAIEIELPGFRRYMDNFKTRLDIAIHARWSIPAPTMEIHAAVAHADEVALATEWRTLLPAAAGPCPVTASPMRGVIVKPLPWTDAADLFRHSLRQDIDLRSWEVAA